MVFLPGWLQGIIPPGLARSSLLSVTISYSIIILWSTLQCREYSRLTRSDCHGDRLPGVSSCTVLGIYSPQTSYLLGSLLEVIRPVLWRVVMFGNPLVPPWAGAVLLLCVAALFSSTWMAAAKNHACLTFRIWTSKSLLFTCSFVGEVLTHRFREVLMRNQKDCCRFQTLF